MLFKIAFYKYDKYITYLLLFEYKRYFLNCKL